MDLWTEIRYYVLLNENLVARAFVKKTFLYYDREGSFLLFGRARSLLPLSCPLLHPLFLHRQPGNKTGQRESWGRPKG